MIVAGILVAFLGVALQGARTFPWFALAGVGVAVFVFGFFFLLYSIIFGALEWGSKISKSKRGWRSASSISVRPAPSTISTVQRHLKADLIIYPCRHLALDHHFVSHLSKYKLIGLET
jgi:hypothetical protein